MISASGTIKVFTGTGTLVDSIPGLLKDGWGLAFGDDHLWASSPSSQMIYKISVISEGIYLRGDADGDMRVTMSDALHILWWLEGHSPRPLCMDAADANDSGIVDLKDPLHILGYLYLKEAPPPAPFPLCGRDPTPDALGCAEFDCRRSHTASDKLLAE